MSSLIGQSYDFPVGGVVRRGTVEMFQEIGDMTVIWVRLDDGSLERHVAGRRRTLTEPAALAAAILRDHPIHGMPVNEQLRILAAAVVEAHGREKAA